MTLSPWIPSFPTIHSHVYTYSITLDPSFSSESISNWLLRRTVRQGAGGTSAVTVREVFRLFQWKYLSLKMLGRVEVQYASAHP